MGFFKKTDYEKHSDRLHKKLTKIVKTLDSRELKDLSQKVIGKSPQEGTRIFDSEYNLIKRFGRYISHDDYLEYFSHNRKQGKFSDLKLAKFLVMRDILDDKDPDFDYLKQFAKSDDNLDYPIPRNHFSQKVKDAISKIQGNRCAVDGCRNNEFFEFDHIKGRNDNSLSNCQMLCRYHHQRKTNEDAIKIRIEQNLNNGQTIREVKLRPQKPTAKKHSSSVRTPNRRTWKSYSRRPRR